MLSSPCARHALLARWESMAPSRCARTARPALHPPSVSHGAAQSNHAGYCAHTPCPQLAPDPTPLTHFMALGSQELSDICSSAAGGWGYGWGNQPIGLGWGSRSFEGMYRTFGPRLNQIMDATITRHCLRQSCTKVCKMRASFVGLVWCEVWRQLESTLVIQGSLGWQAGCQYSSYAWRRHEGAVCKEGQGQPSLLARDRRLRRRIPFLIVVTKPIGFFNMFYSLYSVDFFVSSGRVSTHLPLPNALPSTHSTG